LYNRFYFEISGHHKSNGQYGAIVVRQPLSDDLNSQYYHFDRSKHVILAADWLHFYAENYVPGQPGQFLEISSVVLNGRGRHLDVRYKKKSFFLKLLSLVVISEIPKITHVCPAGIFPCEKRRKISFSVHQWRQPSLSVPVTGNKQNIKFSSDKDNIFCYRLKSISFKLSLVMAIQ
jgi:hypothetical protein